MENRTGYSLERRLNKMVDSEEKNKTNSETNKELEKKTANS